MVSAEKKKLVQELAVKLKSYPLIGILDLENLPGQQFSNMRRTLRNDGVVITVSRKRLLARALKESKIQNAEALEAKLEGVPALLLSKGNPFALYSKIQKSKSEAPAKPGQKAPRDIVIKAGPTNFAPGPIISELAAVGIRTKVEQGKLSIIQDCTIVKEGDVISAKVSETMKRMDIRPMEIGLNLVSVWENGLIFNAKDLRVDEAEYSQNFTLAAQEALNLAVEAAYPCADTAEMLLQKAFREAKCLSIEQGFLTNETKEEILAKAERQALAVKEEANL
ncbi:50S ribosomal protein L10 [Candidatus Woesearchaeota archaeon]|nr:50S ribosomal protein L10 [Candidatus Woesearchaeota archaeon]